jgi:putative ABC transport system substrate-binding protein
LLSTAETQERRRLYQIGVLHEGFAKDHPALEGLKAGLKELRFQDDRDVHFDVRNTEGNPRRLPEAAKALVDGGVELIFTIGEAATRAAKAATQTIPIVFTLVGDPVQAGIVKEMAHHGGNLTGVSSLTTRLAPKRLEVLKRLVPGLRRVWAIYPAGDRAAQEAVREARKAALDLHLELVDCPVGTPEALAHAVQAWATGDGVLPPDMTTLDIPGQLLQMSLEKKVPAVFSSTFWVKDGGLLSYGTDYYAEGLQAAWLVAKILQGAHPRDLPVEGANKIELAVNLKSAEKLGLTVPRQLLLRADKVME